MPNDSNINKESTDQPMPENHQLSSEKQKAPENEIFSNKRIAKNTLVLYIRMIFMTLLSLYTSRVILQTLGVADYGVWSAVGGVISMMGILTKSLSKSISRHLTFELGRGDMKKLKMVFSTSVNVQLFIALVILLVGSTLGFWFLNNKMNIPDGRLDAANWVMWSCIINFMISLVNVPYSAAIVSHEKMSVYAYMTIFEAILNLSVVGALYFSPMDKLKTYAVLAVFASIIVRAIYMIYCRRKFEECRYQFVFNVPMLKELTSFAGWNFFGEGAWVFNTQGIDLLVNIFFGVTLNAARGIAGQVNAISTKFVTNFMTALEPQITKTYAAGHLQQMHQLVCRGAKFSFFLTILFAIPLGFEAERLLRIWLGTVPDYSVLFVRLTFLSAITTVLGNTLVTAQFATGKIKKYQIIMTICGFWVFPLTWLAFELGGGPAWSYIIFIAVYFGLIFVRFYLVKDLIHISWSMYLKDVLLKCLVVLVIAVIPPLVLMLTMPSSILRFILVCLISFTSSGLVIYWIGMKQDERKAIKGMIQGFISKTKTKA
ncbi:MAG: lipopolysaccharide biosynthesis protein [Muribaculaceae bacterium]|nr:lipopolysaccharide biosynthesis protein [Muribaculaceae bacterium]